MTPFAGVWLWIWNLPQSDGGDPAAIVERLRSAGASGAIVKGCDGAGTFTNDWGTIMVLGAALRAAGLGFATWGYNYNGSASEAAVAVRLCQAVQPDAHVFDVEQEMENLARPDLAATALVQQVRLALPALTLAYAPIGSIRNHLRAPYRQFTNASLVMLPQCYYVGFGWTPEVTLSEFYADAAAYNLTNLPIYPAYEDAPLAGAGSTPADVRAFALAASSAGATGVSVWSYEALDAAGWQRVAVAAQVFPSTAPVAPPFDDAARLQLIGYVAGGSGPADIAAWVQQYEGGSVAIQLGNIIDVTIPSSTTGTVAGPAWLSGGQLPPRPPAPPTQPADTPPDPPAPAGITRQELEQAVAAIVASYQATPANPSLLQRFASVKVLSTLFYQLAVLATTIMGGLSHAQAGWVSGAGFVALLISRSIVEAATNLNNPPPGTVNVPAPTSAVTRR